MACCFEELGGYAVTPMLVSSCNPDKCCEGSPLCYPCLPQCPKGQVMFWCEKPPQQKCCRMSDCDKEDWCSETPKKTPPPPVICKRQHSRPSQEYCCPTCYNPCKQVKTKYVIPCYRYEDGRIVNQPTILTRRACEVAVGARPRRKPFVSSSYSANSDEEIHRYISQDERGNCCYHFEKKKNNEQDCCQASKSSSHCGDCVRATIATPPKNCYYYCC